MDYTTNLELHKMQQKQIHSPFCNAYLYILNSPWATSITCLTIHNSQITTVAVTTSSRILWHCCSCRWPLKLAILFLCEAAQTQGQQGERGRWIPNTVQLPYTKSVSSQGSLCSWSVWGVDVFTTSNALAPM